MSDFNALLVEHYADRIPASRDTLAKLPYELRRFLSGRKRPTELAAKVWLAESMRSGMHQGGSRSARLKRSGKGRRVIT